MGFVLILAVPRSGFGLPAGAVSAAQGLSLLVLSDVPVTSHASAVLARLRGLWHLLPSAILYRCRVAGFRASVLAVRPLAACMLPG